MSNLSLVNGTWVLGQAATAGLPDWELIDVTDGSWTSGDPGGNGRVSSVSVSGTDTTVTWNTFTATTNDEISGTTFEGQRYSQALTYADGTAVSLSDDGFTLETWVDIPAVAGCARTQFALGISSDPTATANNTINLGGLYWSPDRTDGVAYIGQIRTSASPLTAFNLDNQYGYGRSAFIGVTRGLAFGWAIQSSGASTGFNNRSLANYSGNLFLQLNMGAVSGRAITAGETNVFSIFYRVLKTPIGPVGNAP